MVEKVALDSKNCPFEPLEDNLIVKKLKAAKTAGGILLPDSDTKGRFAAKGEVLAVGPGHANDKGGYDPLPIKSDDLILFSNQAGLELTDVLRLELSEYGISDEDAKNILLLRSIDVVCKIKTSSTN